MSPCALEITGISGSLQIYGIGTALFLAECEGSSVVLCVHNCLCGHGEFNLISVSQLVQQKGNVVDFSVVSPNLTIIGPKGRKFRFPLFMDEGLFGMKLEPLQMNDSRYSRYPKCDVTPGGVFSFCTSETPDRWQAKVLVSGTSSARILVSPALEYDWKLQSFCSDFLAPPSIPSARRQYDPHSELDMSQLSIRFLGVGTDRLLQTLAISKGLKTPASKFKPRVPPLNFPPGRWKEGKTPKVSKGKNKLSSQCRHWGGSIYRHFRIWRLKVSLRTSLCGFGV